jgi:hypothetical protein
MPRSKRWVAKVKTDSTHPARGLFTRSASGDCQSIGVKACIAEGATIGNVKLFHLPWRKRFIICPQKRARKGQEDTVGTHPKAKKESPTTERLK